MLPLEKSKSKVRRSAEGPARVPGEIPEPPTFRSLADIDSRSIAASSLSSIGSVLNLVRQEPSSTPQTIAPSSAVSTITTQSSVRSTAKCPASTNFGQIPYPVHPCENKRSQSNVNNVIQDPPRATSSQPASSDSRFNAIQSAEERRKANNHLIETNARARAVEEEKRYTERKQESRNEWRSWQSASTRYLESEQSRRYSEKKDEESKRRQEFQDMIDRQIALERSGQTQVSSTCYYPYPDDQQVNTRTCRDQVQKVELPPPTPIVDTSGFFAGENSGAIQGALRNKRKQSLLHRLVRPLTNVDPVYEYRQVAECSQVAPELTADELNSETLFLVNGELIDLSIFDGSRKLSSRAADSYLSILEVRNSKAVRDREVQIWSSNSVYCPPEVNIGVYRDGTVQETSGKAIIVKDDFLAAVGNAEKILVGIIDNDTTSVAYVVDKSKKKIIVKDLATDRNQRCFEKVKTAIAQRLKEDGWDVEYLLKPLLPYLKSVDAAFHAMYAIEAFLSGKDVMVGVKSIEDYKQKMKWSIINEADSCIKVLQESQAEVKRQIKECHSSLIAKVEASRNLTELLDSLPSFKPLANKLYCQNCAQSKSFKPITIPLEAGANQFYYLKGNVTKHLKSETHRHNLGIRVEVAETHPENAYRKAKDYADLLELYPWLEKGAEDTIICGSCQSATFMFPKEDAVDYPQKFSQVKSRVRSHSTLVSHKLRVENKTSEADATAGRNLALNAYLCIKDCLGLVEYERTVSNDSAKEVPVGEMNHSRGFVAEMRKHFASVLRSKFVKQINRTLKSTARKPKVSIVADKCTLFGKSYHVIGCVAHMNGKFHSYLMDIVETSGDDGKSMANDIYNCLKEYFTPEEMKEVILGACMDGQYHHNNVPEKLMDLMGIPQEHREAYTYQWDNAHVIEVICKHARGQKEGMSSISEVWIRNTLTTISNISVDYRQGASLKRLKELAAQLEQDEQESLDLKRFQTYSKTRFSSHLSNFIEAMDHNYPILYKHFEESGASYFGTISTPEFVLRMSALGDLYRIIANTSKKLQVVHKLPWHSSEAVDELRVQLNKVVTACSSESFRPTVDVLPKFSACAAEVLQYQSYKGLELNMVPQKRTRSSTAAEPYPNVVLKEAASVAAHARALTEQLDAKFVNKPGKGRKTVPELCGAGTLDLVSNCFSLAKMKEEVSVDNLRKLYHVYTSAGLLNSDRPFSEFESQYRNFREEALQAHPDNVDVKTETDFYVSKLDGQESSCPLLMEVLSLSVNRNCVETVVETMTSQIGSIMEGRANLSTPNLADEMIIRHNGPPAGRKAEKLVVEALDLKFKGRPWKFHRTSGDKQELKVYEGGSKVLQRLQSGEEKIVF